MKTKLSLLLFISVLFANAQNTILLTTGTSTAGGGSSVHIGAAAGNGTSSTGQYNVFVGTSSGNVNTSGSSNTFLGVNSGFRNLTGTSNAFLGGNAGSENQSGSYNTFAGINSGLYSKGDGNSYFGYMAGFDTTIGTSSSFGGNSFFGYQSGKSNTSGVDNTYYGSRAGYSNLTGTGNVFLGNAAGYNETNSNKLYVANTGTATPLIWGDFTNSQLKLHGKVGIGGNVSTSFGSFPTTAGGVNVSSYNLFVKGGILTDEVRVALNSTWADYVFAQGYDLKPLSEVEQFIKENGHLPNVPAAKKVETEGINVAEMAKIHQEKIEELTLYLIQQSKELEVLKEQVRVLSEKK